MTGEDLKTFLRRDLTTLIQRGEKYGAVGAEYSASTKLIPSFNSEGIVLNFSKGIKVQDNSIAFESVKNAVKSGNERKLHNITENWTVSDYYSVFRYALKAYGIDNH